MAGAEKVLAPQPNKIKPPLQVLAVVEGNSEKIRFRIKHVMWEYIGLNIKLSTRISHRIFLISCRRLGWSLPKSRWVTYWAERIGLLVDHIIQVSRSAAFGAIQKNHMLFFEYFKIGCMDLDNFFLI